MSDGMTSSEKRVNEVKLRLTDSELLDASRLAAADDRALSEFVVLCLRRSMYGILGQRCQDHQGPDRDSPGRRG